VTVKVGLWGASGYAGAELMRLGMGHPGIEFVHLGTRSHVGESIDTVFPAFKGHLEGCFEALDPKRAGACDVLFSCLPHGQSHGALAPLVGETRIIDLSGDFRLRDAAQYERAYGSPHPHEDLIPRFVYGLPELQREAVRTAEAVANPGCFATACILALLPLARAGWLQGDVYLSAITGSSGSGAKPSSGSHHPNRSQDFYAYKRLEHQHEPEIAQTLAAAGGRGFRLNLVTHSAPLVRGIHVTAFVPLPPGMPTSEVTAVFEQQYAAEPFIRFQPDVHVAQVRGLNQCDLSWISRDQTLVVTAAIDNLVKGASGQAIQNFNLMTGFPETTALSFLPMVV